MTSTLAIILTVISTVIGAFGALFFKIAANKLKLNLKSIITNSRLYLAVFLYVLASVSFIYALSLEGSELSILFPIVSLSYVWVAFVSRHFLKEELNSHKWIGIGMIVLGVIFIGLGS